MSDRVRHSFLSPAGIALHFQREYGTFEYTIHNFIKTMNYFLLKTEPSEYSFDDLVKEKYAVWSGVAAAPALLHLRSMNKGDNAFIYHTGKEKQIVGIASIVSAPYPDPNADDAKLVVVDIRAAGRLKRPVTLAEVKMTKTLSDMPLVRIGRLSVQPVTRQQWDIIISLSKS